MHALNLMLHALPQMLDKTGAGGIMTKGFFNTLIPVLGKNFFDDANTGSRWDHFTASGSNRCGRVPVGVCPPERP